MPARSTLVAFAVSLALGATSQIASAQSVNTVSIKLKTADIDLSTGAGARLMLQRIRSAAKAACVSDDPVYYSTYDYHPCVDAIITRAVKTLGSPMVTALNGAGTAGSHQIATTTLANP